MLAGLVAGGMSAAVAGTDPPSPAGSWIPGFHIPGVKSGQIKAFCEYQGDLVVAGTFRGLGGVGARRVARWDGERWHPLGRGMEAEVRALCVYRGDLIAAGSFRTAGDSAAGHIARWDGSRWHTLGAGLDGAVNALAVCQDTLFVGGWFEHAGGAPAFRLATWDGSSWSDGGFQDPNFEHVRVEKLAAFAGRVAGIWSWYDNPAMGPGGSLPMLRVGRGWRQLPDVSSFDGWHEPELEPRQITFHQDELYVGGSLRRLNPHGAWESGPRVARWTGNAWAMLGDSADYPEGFVSIGSYQGNLVLARPRSLDWWDGLHWRPLVSAPDEIDGFLPRNGGIDFLVYQWRRRYAVLSANVLHWNGADWRYLIGADGSGFDGYEAETKISQLAPWGASFVALGTFILAGRDSAHVMAIREGMAWRTPEAAWSLYSSYPTAAGSVCAASGALYFAQNHYGGPYAGRVLRWDGADLEGIGNFPAYVFPVLFWRDRLVVGGAFAHGPSGVSVPRIAIKTDSGWSAPGGGLNDAVVSLTSWKGDLIAAGHFTASADRAVALTHIGRWDGHAWCALGGGLPHPVSALTPFAGGCAAACSWYAGAPNRPTNATRGSVHWWDGTDWRQLGDEFNGSLSDLAVFHGRLVAAGYFLDEREAGGVAAWTGTRWEVVGGTGTDGPVAALLPLADTLWVGGSFHTAGGTPSSRIAGWVEASSEPIEDLRAEPVQGQGATRVRVSWTQPADPAFAHAVVRASRFGFPVDPADGEAVWPEADDTPSAGPGEPMSVLWAPRMDGAMRWISAFALDEHGVASAAAQSSVRLPDESGPRLDFHAYRRSDAAGGAVRLECEVRVDKKIDRTGVRVRLEDGSSVSLQPPAQDSSWWSGVIELRDPRQANRLDAAATDLLGREGTVSLQLAAARIDPFAGGRCELSTGPWVDCPPRAVADSSWLTLVERPDRDAPSDTPVSEWEIALGEAPRQPLAFVYRQVAYSPSEGISGKEHAPIDSEPDLTRLALLSPSGLRLSGAVDPRGRSVTYFLQENGIFRLLWSDVSLNRPADPEHLVLATPSPQPFRDRVAFRIDLETRQLVRMQVFDAAGRRVAEPLDAMLGPGPQIVVWNDGRALPSGLYFGRLEGERTSRVVRLVHVR
jgi:hypothetical protein